MLEKWKRVFRSLQICIWLISLVRLNRLSSVKRAYCWYFQLLIQFIIIRKWLEYVYEFHFKMFEIVIILIYIFFSEKRNFWMFIGRITLFVFTILDLLFFMFMLVFCAYKVIGSDLPSFTTRWRFEYLFPVTSLFRSRCKSILKLQLLSFVLEL